MSVVLSTVSWCWTMTVLGKTGKESQNGKPGGNSMTKCLKRERDQMTEQILLNLCSSGEMIFDSTTSGSKNLCSIVRKIIWFPGQTQLPTKSCCIRGIVFHRLLPKQKKCCGFLLKKIWTPKMVRNPAKSSIPGVLFAQDRAPPSPLCHQTLLFHLLTVTQATLLFPTTAH